MTAKAKPSILILDDDPMYSTRNWIPALEQKYDVANLRWAHRAYDLLRHQAFELVILDLILDDPMPPALEPHARIVDAGLRGRKFRSDMSSQALGLWLWAREPSIRQPYCYVTNYLDMWVPDLKIEKSSLEFCDASAAQRAQLVCLRGKEGEPLEFVERVLKIWHECNWVQPLVDGAL